MLAIGFPAAAFDTNCFVLATQRGEECLVVDPGIGVVDTLGEVFAEFGLRPAAVLLTHGHLDHVYSVTPVCGGTLAAYLHREDRYRLRDPFFDLDPMMVGMMEAQFGAKATWAEPQDVVEIVDAQTISLVGLDFTVVHAPGHTEGSVMFVLDDVPDQARGQVASTVVTGDVLFAGSIGRSDLPGGDEPTMMRSLRELILPMPDDRLVLPGHGPATTIGAERGSNPFLRMLQTR